MIEDILYKLLRKSLPQGLFKAASRVFGRHKHYHKVQTYRNIYDIYRQKGLQFRGKTVLEVGPGSQLFTAFLYLADGADRVIVADPKVDPSSFESQRLLFNESTETPLGREIRTKLFFFEDTSRIPSSFDAQVDLICSHTVLEHIPDLESFFADNVRLMAPTGESCHLVDVSDHTYHLLSKFPRLANLGYRRSLYHLRYSNFVFGLLNDPKTYMNRTLLPVHRNLIRKAGLKITELQRGTFARIPIHPDLLDGVVAPDPADLYLTEFFYKLSK